MNPGRAHHDSGAGGPGPVASAPATGATAAAVAGACFPGAEAALQLWQLMQAALVPGKGPGEAAALPVLVAAARLVREQHEHLRAAGADPVHSLMRLCAMAGAVPGPAAGDSGTGGGVAGGSRKRARDEQLPFSVLERLPQLIGAHETHLYPQVI